jgi:hypothetical protein
MCSLVDKYQNFEEPTCINRQTFILKREAEVWSETLAYTYKTTINMAVCRYMRWQEWVDFDYLIGIL